MPPKLIFHPPLLNSASPWATTADNLRALLLCRSTGAITTRTALLGGFDHRPERHRYLFFDPGTARPHPGSSSGPPEPPPPLPSSSTTTTTTTTTTGPPVASLNTLGYSPVSLAEYLAIISSLAADLPPWARTKPIIISIAGTPRDISQAHAAICSAAPSVPFPLAVEINLSCPNIPSAPPPAYSPSSLAPYLDALPESSPLPVGVKTPPFTYDDQFSGLVSALRGSSSSSNSNNNGEDSPASKLSFVTATNTLGSCLILPPSLPPSSDDDALLGAAAGIGGMAGPPLHPLALGNVAMLRRLFDADPRLAHLDVIGVGGVYDGQGYRRMRRAGAAAVAVGTALGRRGVGVFEAIEEEIGSSW